MMGDRDGCSDKSFRVIEEEFQSFTQTFKSNADLSPFYSFYEKLFITLVKTESERKQFQEKIHELNLTTNELKKDTEKAQGLAEVGRRKEEAISSTVFQLQGQLTKLSSELEEERTNNSKQDDRYKEMVQDHEELKTETAKLSEEMKILKKVLKDAESRNESLETKVGDLRTKNTKLLDDISVAGGKIKKERVKCEQTEKEFAELRSALDIKTKSCIDLQYSLTFEKNKTEKQNKDLRDANKNLENQIATTDELCHRAKDLSETLKGQTEKIEAVTANLQKSRKELELSQNLCRKMTSEKSQLQRKFDNEHKAVSRLQQAAEHAKSANRASQQEIQTLHRDLDKMKEIENDISRQRRVLERERNMQIDKIHRTEQMVKQADEDAWHQEHTMLSLEKDLAAAKAQIDTLQKKVHSLDQTCEKHSNDVSEGRVSLDKANNEVYIRGIEIQEMKKEIRELESKLKEEEQVSNRLCAERGKSSRELIEVQKENEIMKNENSVLTMEFKNLRNELSLKEESLVRTHFDQRKEITKNEQVNNTVSLFKRHMTERDNLLQKQDLEINRLNSSLKRMDEDVLNQKKEYDQLINERDILSAQLIRRNDELALLYEKVKIQTNTLKKGEVQYKERLEDLRHLKIKLQDVQRELDSIKGGTVDISGITKELAQKDKELLYEKVKVKALSEELQNPLNVHRWRKLEGSDPGAFELVQKNEILQKRLIKKTEEVVEKDAIIQEKEEHVLMLRKQLIRKPGIEITDKLKIKENEVREKSRQMKAMAGELNMNQVQVNEYKKEVNRLNNELHDLKHKFFEQKKKEAINKDKELQWFAESGLACIENAYCEGSESITENRKLSGKRSPYQKIRFVGGGFAVK